LQQGLFQLPGNEYPQFSLDPEIYLHKRTCTLVLSLINLHVFVNFSTFNPHPGNANAEDWLGNGCEEDT
jgi:hypothetical protein